jgi:hypothetical protein
MTAKGEEGEEREVVWRRILIYASSASQDRGHEVVCSST